MATTIGMGAKKKESKLEDKLKTKIAELEKENENLKTKIAELEETSNK